MDFFLEVGNENVLKIIKLKIAQLNTLKTNELYTLDVCVVCELYFSRVVREGGENFQVL